MMSRDKQIEEMAKDMCEYYYEGTCYQDKKPCDCKCDIFTDAQYLYAKGYRKASEVAEEIFAEIEKEIESAIESNYRAKKEHYNHSVIPNYDNFTAMCDGKIYAMRGLLDFMAELKKKCTESEDTE